MRVEYTVEFKKNYQQLPPNVKERVKKQISLLLENPRHSSLNTKKLQGYQNLWQGRINKAYRFIFIFTIENDIYKLIAFFHHK